MTYFLQITVNVIKDHGSDKLEILASGSSAEYILPEAEIPEMLEQAANGMLDELACTLAGDFEGNPFAPTTKH